MPNEPTGGGPRIGPTGARLAPGAHGRAVLLVDDYGYRDFHAEALAARDLVPVYVHTPQLLARFPTARSRPHLVGDDPERIARELAALKPRAVIPVGESGVVFSEALCRALGLPPAIDGDPLRVRDKFIMNDLLRQRGVPGVEQTVVEHPDQAVEWVTREHGRWPVIVKPRDSVAGDGVFLCSNPTELAMAVRTVQSADKVLYESSRTNDQVLVQEYLDGPEYIVDTVTADGRHHTLIVARYTLETRGMRPVIKDRVDLLPYDELARTLESYIFQVLDALQLRRGVAHSEVRMTRDGPRLVEIGARTGGRTTIFSARLTDFDPFRAAIDAHTEGSRLRRRARPGYELRGTGLNVFVRANRGGTLSRRGIEAVESLPTFRDAVWAVPPGAAVRKTVDLNTVLGWVFLADGDPTRVERDYALLRCLEDRHAFVATSERQRPPGDCPVY